MIEYQTCESCDHFHKFSDGCTWAHKDRTAMQDEECRRSGVWQVYFSLHVIRDECNDKETQAALGAELKFMEEEWPSLIVQYARELECQKARGAP